ncbi:carbon starvation protein A [Alteribacillus sp. JSM 102045]|uniref:carbon starvation CstA family protein n=1 Tax=Alteribacillus sp. JSM 102045 TaxID=1562101 RepID=UPI0035C1BEEE
MPAIVLAIIGLIIFALGYRYYSKFIAERIYRLDPNYQTPAHQFRDGVDFVPTNKWVLWGHHFTSVAGAAPIVGPAIAVYWGWLPAFLWVVLGTVFAAGVHDFGTLVLSIRNKGQSIGTLAERIIGRRAKLLFLFIILILVLMVNAVFAWVISNLFITFPSSVLAVFIQIPLAIWIGYTVNKKGKSMLLPSLTALAVMYAAAVIASSIPALQIDLVTYFGGEEATGLFGLDAVSSAFLIWIAILMVYVYIASILPVWKLLQPRDYINSHQLVVGLAILYLGLFFTWPTPEVTAPATREVTDVSWFPLLFITIACGAISGFHGLVSSGTSSKQLNKETDARFVGYLGAVGEGTLALVTILAVTTFFASSSDFLSSYESFDTANADGLTHFVGGAGQLATGLGLPAGVAETIVAVIVVSFAATTLDTSVRLMRYIISELGQEYKAPALTKKHVATTIAVGASAFLVLLPGDRGFGSGGYLLWPLFGTSNQLLAGISLLLISIWLRRKGRNFLFTFIPMVFLLFMTLWAMTTQVVFQWSGLGDGDTQILLFVLGAIILGFSVWILLEAVALFRKEPPNTEPDNDK